MRKAQRDALAVIDTAYGSAASEDEWMDALHEAIVKALGEQAVVALYDVHAAGYTMRNVRANEHRQFWVETSTSPPHLSQLHWATAAPARSSLATELVAVLGDAALTAWRSRERPEGVADLHYLRSVDLAARKMVILSTAASRENAPNEMFGPWYASVTDHIVSAMRLRRTIGALPEHADLVLKCDGAPVHQLVAVRPDERDALTAAIGDVEAAHRRAYAGDALWPALVAGTWTLVQHIDTDARRFYLAVRNHDAMVNPCAFTQREREVAQRVASGETNESIAIDLHATPSLVTGIVRNVLTKLRLRRRLDLPWLVHGMLEQVWSDANDAFATWQMALDEDALGRLSVSEREVAILLVRGLSNAEIAAERGSAVRTVANQVRSIASKLGVSGRIEIAVALLEGV